MAQIIYIGNCTEFPKAKVEALQKDMRPVSYCNLCKLIKKDYPQLFNDLALDFLNPWAEQCGQTKTHYILKHSAIEYFFKKNNSK